MYVKVLSEKRSCHYPGHINSHFMSPLKNHLNSWHMLQRYTVCLAQIIYLETLKSNWLQLARQECLSKSVSFVHGHCVINNTIKAIELMRVLQLAYKPGHSNCLDFLSHAKVIRGSNFMIKFSDCTPYSDDHLGIGGQKCV